MFGRLKAYSQNEWALSFGPDALRSTIGQWSWLEQDEIIFVGTL